MPEVAPGLARRTAHEDTWVLTGLLIDHTIVVPRTSGNPAAGEVFLRPSLGDAEEDERLRWGISVAALPEGVDPTDRRRKPVSGSVQINRAGCSVVAGENSQASTLPRR